jgi:hypothetical protein
MPWYQFLWTDDNIAHLAEHDVTPEQFEDVVMHSQVKDFSRTSGRPATRGYDDHGRLLFCVYEMIEPDVIYPVTAYEVRDAD